MLGSKPEEISLANTNFLTFCAPFTRTWVHECRSGEVLELVPRMKCLTFALCFPLLNKSYKVRAAPRGNAVIGSARGQAADWLPGGAATPCYALGAEQTLPI